MAAPRRRILQLLAASSIILTCAANSGPNATASWRDSQLWGDLATATSASPALTIPQADGFPCERPYGERVDFHVIIPTVSRRSYERLHYLGQLGLTGAQIFVYLRTDPGDDRQVAIRLPCNMTLHERLLLPNQADESAAMFTHVALHYDHLPDALVLLHGGFLHSWHAKCSVALRRLRAYYRGLGTGPQATPAARAFASRAQTLNSCTRGGIHQDCCGSLFCQVHTSRGYGEGCPWERVGSVNVTLEHQSVTQPLCQLRDRTPDTNWTVLGYDVPDFFVRQSQILRQYEDDPKRLVPITHTPAPRPHSSDAEPGADRALIDTAATEASDLFPPTTRLELRAVAGGGAPIRGHSDPFRAGGVGRALLGTGDAARADSPQSAPDGRPQARWVMLDSYFQRDRRTGRGIVAQRARFMHADDFGGRAGWPWHGRQSHEQLMERVMARQDAARWGGAVERPKGGASRGEELPRGDGARLRAWADDRTRRVQTPASPPEPQEQGRAVLEDYRPRLDNAKDVLLPQHRGGDLVPSVGGIDQSHGRNGAILGTMRLWSPYIRAYGIKQRWAQPPKQGEWDQNWGSLQPIVPRHALQRVPKEFWEDTAFLMLHVGWRDRDFWTTAWGMMFEWHFWPMIDQRRTTAEALRVYVDIEREMGEDAAMATCSDGVRTTKPN